MGKQPGVESWGGYRVAEALDPEHVADRHDAAGALVLERAVLCRPCGDLSVLLFC